MSILRLFGVGVLFAVALPMHGTRSLGDPEKLPELAAAPFATPSVRVAAAASGRSSALASSPSGESTRLRALRSGERDGDLFRSLPDAQRSCEGSSCAPPTPVASREPDEDRSWMANLRMPEIPVKAHERVRQYVEYFTQNTDGRRVFRTWLKRSGRYAKSVGGALREQLMPQDLQAVVFVESGYSPKAVSTAGAVGLWQLMAGTARIYGLAVESDFDERRSVDRASQAAVKHLGDLRDRFGSWELALAAYNMGYKALLDRVKDVSTNDFWTLSEIEGVLPRETALYVPKVIATALILRNLDRFGLDDVRPDPPMATADLDVPAGTSLALVARAAGTSVRALREMNPEILGDMVPDRGRTLAVHIPSAGAGRAQSMLARLIDRRDREGNENSATASAEDFDWGRDDAPRRSASRRAGRERGDFFDTVDGGDVAFDPAPRRRTRIPQNDDEPTTLPSAGRGNVILYRVGENESVASIAKSFGTTTSQLVEDNYLDPGGKLQKGMLLIVEVSSKSMQRLMKKRAQGRLDDGAAEPVRAADRDEREGDEPRGRSAPLFHPTAGGTRG